MSNLIIAVVISGGLSFGLGYLVRKIKAKSQVNSAELQAEKTIEEAKTKAKEILLKAKDDAFRFREQIKKEENEHRNKLLQFEERLNKRQEILEEKIEILREKRDKILEKEKEVEKLKEQVKEIYNEQSKKLEKISRLSREEAKKTLLERIEKEMADDLVNHIKKLETQFKEQADEKAQEIISSAIQKLAVPQTIESTVYTIHLPSEEMKGRIIGREGRNINAIERATGADVIVDDTPEAIVISCFDPVRRYIAKIALEKLISDGRIQPSRIEETVQEAKKEVAKIIKEKGEQTVYETGVAGLPDDLIKLLGRLHFRTSYGQNVLKHSIEVSFLASALAAEIGADAELAKKAGLLHDIGKAVDHEVPGSHAIIGGEIAKKFGLSEKIINAIEAHHEEKPYQSVEAIIVQTADAISGARPGARRETLENYIKRLTELENIANSFEGVEKSFAIQAGREVRVIVMPEKIDDLKAIKLAKEIANKIENELKYPGQIKVNVIRETRAIEYAD